MNNYTKNNLPTWGITNRLPWSHHNLIHLEERHSTMSLTMFTLTRIRVPTYRAILHELQHVITQQFASQSCRQYTCISLVLISSHLETVILQVHHLWSHKMRLRWIPFTPLGSVSHRHKITHMRSLTQSSTLARCTSHLFSFLFLPLNKSVPTSPLFTRYPWVWDSYWCPEMYLVSYLTLCSSLLISLISLPFLCCNCCCPWLSIHSLNEVVRRGSRF